MSFLKNKKNQFHPQSFLSHSSFIICHEKTASKVVKAVFEKIHYEKIT